MNLVSIIVSFFLKRPTKPGPVRFPLVAIHKCIPEIKKQNPSKTHHIL